MIIWRGTEKVFMDTSQKNVDTTQRTRDYRGLSFTSKIQAIRISTADLRRLCAILQEKAQEALELHVNGLAKGPSEAEDGFENRKNWYRQWGGVRLTIIGAQGEQIVSSSCATLADDALPERVVLITFDSFTSIQAAPPIPLNRFKLVIDVKDPPLFIAYNPWSQPTPNSSLLEVIGSDTTWVTAVHGTVLEVFRQNRTRRAWIHSSITFNALQWLVLFPAALWIMYRIASYFEAAFSQMHVALRGTIYIYAFLLSLLAFRQILAGVRWVFPLVELEGTKKAGARNSILGLIGSLIIGLIVDIFDKLFLK